MLHEQAIIDQFCKAMLEHDIEVSPAEIVADGKLRRIHVDGDRNKVKNGWYILHADGLPSGAFGCNRRYGNTVKFTWTAEKSSKPLTPAERRAWREEMTRKRREREAAERAQHEAARAEAARIWERAKDATSHPYLTRKGIRPHGLRIGVWEKISTETGEVRIISKLALLVPIRDAKKQIHSLQAIFPNDRNALGRDKDYLSGGEKRGLFYSIGKPIEHAGRLVILICEGYATGATLHECTGHAVIVAFDAGNLVEVAKVIRARFADAVIVIAADNDRWTLKPVENPGITRAREAAASVDGLIAVPDFVDLDGKPTDFNDLHRLEGTEAVAGAIDAVLNPPVPPEPEDRPLPWEGEPDFPTDDETPEPESDMPGTAPDADDVDPADGIARQGGFTILGYEHGNYYLFLHEKKQIMEYTRRDFSASGLIEIADQNFWELNFPGKNGVNTTAAANFIIRVAHNRGVYDPNNVRASGAWIDEDRYVFHHGSYLSIDGLRTDVTSIKSRYVYELTRTLPPPADAPLSDADGTRILDVAKMLRWSRPGSAALLAGWVFLAPICGALRWRPHVWLTGPAGNGKSQPHSSKVLTPSGWVSMGDIKVGDIVTTPDNDYGRVYGVFPQGKIPVYKLTFADGRTARASGDHLWKVRLEGMWRIRTTEQMIEILSRGTRQSTKLAVPLSDAVDVVQNHKATLPIHPYVLGALLGDGSFGTSIGLTSVDDEIVNRVSLLAPDGCALKAASANSLKEFRFVSLDKARKPMRSLIKELRLLDTRSHDKYIPAEYLSASVPDRIELLKGLMDTDGFVGKTGNISYCIISRRLANDVVALVRSLGGIASITDKKTSYTHNGEKKEGQPAFNVNIRLRNRAMAFHLQRKLDRVNGEYQYADCLYLNVESIELDGEEECSCIAIDHPDRLYITDDFVVTHNTTILEKFVFPLLGKGGCIYGQGNSTEAGVRQAVGSHALPVLLDEAEKNDEKEAARVESLLSLIRQSSTESAAETLKGTVGGGGMSFHVRSMFCLASILVGLEKKADIDRLSILTLMPSRGVTGAIEHWEETSNAIYDLTRDPDVRGRMLRRAINMMPRIRYNIEVFVKAAAKSFGSQRDGDQYGTLLAGAWSLTSSEPATPADAEMMIGQFSWDEHIEQGDTDDSKGALSALMGAMIRDGGAQISVHELITRSLGESVEGVSLTPETARGLLRRHGVLVSGDRLILPNQSTALRNLLDGTPYAADPKSVFGRLQGATNNDGKQVKFNGIKTRVVSVPLSLVGFGMAAAERAEEF